MKLHDVRAVRSMLLAILVFGLIGTEVELLFLGHDEDAMQFIPLVLIGVGLAVIGWYAIAESGASLFAMRITMTLFVAAGLLGIALHYSGNVEFQKELDPSANGFGLFIKAMQSKAPPALAPGVMVYIGLLGLVCSHRLANRGEGI
jgi:hypothetical protein